MYLSIVQGAALGTMVGLLTYGKKRYEDLDDVMRKTIGPLHDNLQKMMPLVDRDSEAFAEYMVSRGDFSERESNLFSLF